MPSSLILQNKILNIRQSRVRAYLWYCVQIVIIAIVYVVAAKLGLSLAFSTKQVTTVWPPTGIALAVLFLFGLRLWPGVMIGAFFANLFTAEPPLVALSIAIGNTLEAVIGSYCLKFWFKIRPELDRNIDVLAIIVGAFFCTAISATIGVTSLIVGGLASQTNFWPVWSVWWVGDMLGALVVAPFILSWLAPATIGPKSLRSKLEFVALIIFAVVLSILAFQEKSGNATTGILQFQYIVFPFIIWAALRFSQREVTLVTLIVSFIAIFYTLHGYGPFGVFDGREVGLFALQLFMGVVSTTALILAATVAERRRSEQTKTELISIASHQLRTPLTAIKWNINLLEENKKLTKAQLKQIHNIFISNDQLIKLVDNLLRVTRIEGGMVKVKKQTTDIVEIIEKAMTVLKPNADSNKQRLILSGGDRPKNALVDPTLLNEVVENLLSNAVAYGAKNSTINININEEPSRYHVAITNQGSYIPPSESKKLFTKFYRGPEALKLKATGNGLGLFIAKSAVESNGGSLGFESSREHGTTFFFTVPRK